MNRINEREALRQYLLENGLYMVQKSEFETLANDAAKSFKDYPLCIYITGDKYDEDLTSQNLRVSLNCMIDDGIIYSDSKDLNGLVILMPPGYTGIKTLSYIWNGGFKVLYHQGISAMKRIANYESFAMDIRKKYTNYEDWYLYYIYVKEEAKGKKICSKLVKPLLNYIKANKKMCYLETHSHSNVPVYEHFGFKIVEKCMLPNSNVAHYSMLFDCR